MTNCDADRSLGQLVAEHVDRSRVFERFGLDFCCGGDQTLRAACAAKEVDLEQVCKELEEIGDTAEASVPDDWQQRPLSVLCEHIVKTHHAYLREELPRLTALIAKVVGAHGSEHPELREVERTFAALRADLEPHMHKEEQVLFPAVGHLELSSGSRQFPFGSIANPIHMMEHEHENAGEGLAQLRKLTGDYAVPEGACTAYQAMIGRLVALEHDLHLHIHKENNILFPRACAQESAV